MTGARYYLGHQRPHRPVQEYLYPPHNRARYLPYTPEESVLLAGQVHQYTDRTSYKDGHHDGYEYFAGVPLGHVYRGAPRAAWRNLARLFVVFASGPYLFDLLS